MTAMLTVLRRKGTGRARYHPPKRSILGGNQRPAKILTKPILPPLPRPFPFTIPRTLPISARIPLLAPLCPSAILSQKLLDRPRIVWRWR